MKFLLLVLLSLSSLANAEVTQTFETACDSVAFRVTSMNNGHPLDNIYSLTAKSSLGDQEIFKSDVGGWFHAACIANHEDKAFLVFQNYCGGSHCLEGKYGVVDPSSLKLIISPDAANTENHQDVSRLLGYEVPHLRNFNASFCCSK